MPRALQPRNPMFGPDDVVWRTTLQLQVCPLVHQAGVLD